ncbi:MAG TPA: Fic family protein [Candidatus Saccharimonadales bacterium]|nr:Fic family protein [Candidatus Saccharimonadales bacterium]
MISAYNKDKIRQLKKEFEQLRVGKDSLLVIIDEAELPELVYNSNAIENSTLTLRETERILLELEVARNVSVRELFEAKNLARVTEYIRNKKDATLNKDVILLLHQMLIGGINDNIAGRFRAEHEYVRVGAHIAPAPEHIEQLLDNLLADYESSHDEYFLDRISRFHLEFERIHPFVDGNGRIGRVLINVQLMLHGYPSAIIRNKGKRDYYYPAFLEYQENRSTERLDSLLSLSLMESLNKRITYLKGLEIVTLTDYAKQANESPNTLLNAARRQTIPAFREKGVWKIGKSSV